MFHSLAATLEMPLLSADGEKYVIRNLLFDDRSWCVRYLVVETGRWLSSRWIVIPAGEVAMPDWKDKVVRSHLDAAAIEACAGAETVRTVSAQQRSARSRHYGWSENEPFREPPSADYPVREYYVPLEGDDPHLRSTLDIFSFEIWGARGYIGLLERFFLRDSAWQIPYLLVKAGDWIFTEKIIPTSDVVGISWGQHRLTVDSAASAGKLQPAADPAAC